MSQAYYIAAHHKSYQFRWLFASLYNESDLFLVHIDRKACEAFEADCAAAIGAAPNVIVLPRMDVNWGGWSQVKSELSAMRLALRAEQRWSYFVNLSGQDYPIQSRSHIQRSLEQAWPRSFIRVWSHEQVRSTDPLDPHLANRVSVELFGKVKSFPLRFPPSPGKLAYKGSQWHALSREFCSWVTSDLVARRLAGRLRFSLCPDEVFFQAAIMNSPFMHQRMSDCGRLFFFPGPRVLGVADLTAILDSDNLFARKFDSRVDRDVLIEIARNRGFPILDG